MLTYAAAATLSAVVSDRVIETLSAHGAFGIGFGEHDRGGASDMLTAGGILLVTALLFALAEKFVSRVPGDGNRDWLRDTARDISHRWSWRALGESLAIALAVRYAMESARIVHLHGHTAGVSDWLGAPTLLALAIHGFFCAMTFFSLIFAMRSLDGALEELVRFVVAIFVTLANVMPVTRRRADGAYFLRTNAAFLARLFGDRAPPIGFSATP